MAAFFLKQIRRIIAVADWLDDRTANREISALRQRYAPKVAELEKRRAATDEEKKRNWEELQATLAEWHDMRDLVLDPVYGRKADRLTAKARKYGISVPDRKDPSSEAGDENWDRSRLTGDWMLTNEYEQTLRGQIRDEQRASYDEFRKWATLVFAIVGSLLAFISIRTKQKQPDPCPRNYYRNDSGECVFALQKNSRQALGQASPAQTAPSTRTVEKPSPGKSPRSD